jgi:Cytochrome P460
MRQPGDRVKTLKQFQAPPFVPAALLCALAAVATALAASDAGPSLPKNFQHWYLANSMLATKEPNQFGLVAGNHLIYINPVGFDRFRRGGSQPYPDGTVFVDDVRDFALVDGVYQQGARKAVPVMVKNSIKYASTGGWGFQAWAGGDPSKPIVTDAGKQCFGCHMSRKANDYTFSTYLR